MTVPMCSAALEINGLSPPLQGAATMAASTSKEGPGGLPSSASTQRWSKEALRAMETHLSLLQQQEVPPVARPISAYHAPARLVSAHHARTSKPSEAKLPLPFGFSYSGYSDTQQPSVDLSSGGPLPDGWEQLLDLRTGQMFYIDWKSCKRSFIDPRKLLRLADDRIAAIFQQVDEGWELQSTVTELGSCSVTDEVEIQSKVSSEEYFDESWAENDVDMGSSEINFVSPERCGHQGSILMDQKTMAHLTDCQECGFSPMAEDVSPWCPQCRNALV